MTQNLRFSQRIGKKTVKTTFQIDSMDSELKNSLWNVIYVYFINDLVESREPYLYSCRHKDLIIDLWVHFYKERLDLLPNVLQKVATYIQQNFFKGDYLEIYDLIDFLASVKIGSFKADEFIEGCNRVLKVEMSGYRFIDRKLVPITNEVEINEIENTINTSREKGLIGVKNHLILALEMLSDRKSPDYRNSIKESISAVESIGQQITGDKNASLGQTIKKLKGKNIAIHAALEKGFDKLYGWTSDEPGVRHAMLTEPELDQEDALYMLVSCSAFVSYLIAKADKSGIELD